MAPCRREAAGGSGGRRHKLRKKVPIKPLRDKSFFHPGLGWEGSRELFSTLSFTCFSLGHKVCGKES